MKNSLRLAVLLSLVTACSGAPDDPSAGEGPLAPGTSVSPLPGPTVVPTLPTPRPPPPSHLPDLFLSGTVHHYDSNPFAILPNHAGSDHYWVRFPAGTSLDHASVTLLSGNSGATLRSGSASTPVINGETVIAFDVDWWYQPWFDVKYSVSLYLQNAHGSYTCNLSFDDAHEKTGAALACPFTQVTLVYN